VKISFGYMHVCEDILGLAILKLEIWCEMQNVGMLRIIKVYSVSLRRHYMLGCMSRALVEKDRECLKSDIKTCY
jgi:hypothetical protein